MSNVKVDGELLPALHVSQNILGLLFEPKMSEIMLDKNYQRFLYPYLAKVKMVGFLEENLSIVHKENFETAFKAFISFITGANLTNDGQPNQKAQSSE